MRDHAKVNSLYQAKETMKRHPIITLSIIAALWAILSACSAPAQQSDPVTPLEGMQLVGTLQPAGTCTWNNGNTVVTNQGEFVPGERNITVSDPDLSEVTLENVPDISEGSYVHRGHAFVRGEGNTIDVWAQNPSDDVCTIVNK